MIHYIKAEISCEYVLALTLMFCVFTGDTLEAWIPADRVRGSDIFHQTFIFKTSCARFGSD